MDASTLALTFLVCLWPLWGSLKHAYGRYSGTGQSGFPRRGQGLGHLFWQSLAFFWLVFSLLDGAWAWSDVGVSPEGNPALGFCIGLFLYAPFLLVARLAWAVLRIGLSPDANFQVMRMHWPRDPFEKRLVVLSAFVNPFTEEVIFRGFFVFQLSQHLGSLKLALVIGLALCLLLHLYQGFASLPEHALVYAIVVCLLYSPLGLPGAIGFHLAGDVLPLIMLKRDLRSWRERNRGRRGMSSSVHA